MSPKPPRSHRQSRMLSVVRSLIRAALEASDPAEAVRRSLHLEGSRLRIEAPLAGDVERPDHTAGRTAIYSLDAVRRIIVIGAGKAAPMMAAAVERVLGRRIDSGLVITKPSRFPRLRRVEVVAAGHPIPNAAGRAAATRLVRLIRGSGPDDLVLVLLSGGASALLPLPPEGISLRDKQRVTDGLIRAGATIKELNTVRKHLSMLKGGQLALACRPARVVSLILSDVIGNPLDVIGSGPTVPDPSTYRDAVRILAERGLWTKAPVSVRRHLTAGLRGGRPETPKPGHPFFRRVRNIIIGDNRAAVWAVAKRARRLGYRPFILTSRLQGEARAVATLFGTIARRIQKEGRPLRPPACLVAGGELTVTVAGSGKGGRCQEFALAAIKEITGLNGTTLAAFGTDGVDGPTDAAGAVVDHRTLLYARRRGLDPDRYLNRNDSYRFFKTLGGLIRTGPTGTNVNDLYILLVR